MKEFLLAAFDMDGTLLNSGKQIDEETRQAVQEAISAGKIVALSSGRSTAELRSYVEMLPGLRYAVCASGAMVYDFQEEKVCYIHPLTEDHIRRIVAAAQLEDVMPQVHTVTKSIVQKSHFDVLGRYGMAKYRETFLRMDTLVDNVLETILAAEEPALKINLYHTSSERRLVSRERLSGQDFELVDAEQTSLEISPAGVSKALGLASLAKQLHIPMDQVIAVGDSDNDEAMLRAVGLPVAMGNANARIKDLCREVVADNDHNGCAEVIRKYLLHE